MKKKVLLVILTCIFPINVICQVVSDSSYVVPFVQPINLSLRKIIESSLIDYGNRPWLGKKIYNLEFARIHLEDDFNVDFFMRADIGNNEDFLLLGSGKGKYADKGYSLFGCFLYESNYFFVISKDIPDSIMNGLFEKKEHISLLLCPTLKHDNYIYDCQNRIWFLKDNVFYPYLEGQDIKNAYENAR